MKVYTKGISHFEKKEMLFQALLLVCAVECFEQTTITLLPEVNDVLENSSLELTCYAPKNVMSTKWKTLNQPESFSTLTFSKEGVCAAYGFLADNQYFETRCYSNATFRVKIKRVNITNHGQKWYCSRKYTNSNYARITVQVPIENVRIKDIPAESLMTVEKIKTTLTCETSAGRPVAHITWIKISKDGIMRDLANDFAIKVSKNVTQRKMIQATSSIDIIPVREDNDSRIICEATNIKLNVIRAEIKIYVQYPPGRPYLQFTGQNELAKDGIFLTNKVSLEERSSFTVTCKADGFPSPSYSWSYDMEVVTSQNLSFINISKESAGLYMCFAENTIKSSNPAYEVQKKRSTDLEIDVLYQSRIIMFYIDRLGMGDVFEVTENETVIFNCSVESNPESSIALYFGRKALRHNASTKALIHTHRVSSCLDDGIYKCVAHNILNVNQSITELKLLVRCKPIVSPEFNLESIVSTARNLTITFEFKAIAKPTPVFLWFKLSDSVWKNLNTSNKYEIQASELYSNLSVRDINDDDYGKYKLRIQNDVGSIDQLYFLLKENVSSSKLHFTLSEKESVGSKFIVNKNDAISLICFSHSNLLYDDIVIRKRDGGQIALTKNTNSIRHAIRKVTCDDAGEYICSASNIVKIQLEEISKLMIIVKCPPMPSSKYKEDNTVFSLLHSNVILQLQVYEYFDESNNTVFIWYKQNSSLQNDGSKYIISSNGFQSNLLIRHITITDLGLFRVLVRNSYGQYIHFFELQEKEQESTTVRTLLVAVGTFAFTILAVVLAFIGNRHFRRERSERRQVVDHSEVIQQEVNQTAYYEEIDHVYEHVNEQLIDGAEYMEMQSIESSQSIKSEDSTQYYITPTL